MQLFTNGLKLVDKEYCLELCAMGIQVNFGLDGTRPEIYKALRGDNSLEAKRKALENVVECGVNKLVVISTFAVGVNDSNMSEMLDFIHDYRQYVSTWGFVPLTPCWEPGKVALDPTTTECVERVFESMIPGVEFVSTGLMKFNVLSRFFGRQTLGGSHPNCESATLLVSDGEKYLPISSYLKTSLSELLVELRKLDIALGVRSAKIPSTGFRRMFFDLSTFAAIIKVFRKNLDLSHIFGESISRRVLAAVADLLRGRKIDAILKERTSFKYVLTLLTIPYEDKGGLEDARLKDCPAVFAYEDTDTGRIRTTAFCSWQTIKDDVCRKIQAHYQGASAEKTSAESRK